LVVQNERGFANEPLPLGVSLVDAAGEESLVLIGLVAGSRLSVGTPFGSTGWQLSAGSIGNAFVYAPSDFVGVMDAVIDLRSASNQPMDVQVVRFEWIRKKEGYLTSQPDPSKPPPVIPPLDPEEITAVVSPLVVDNRSGPSVQPAPQPDPSKPPPVIPPLDPEEITTVVSPLVADNRSGPSVQPAPKPDPSKPPPVIPPLDPEAIAILIRRGEDFLNAGDMATARISLKRAANAGSAQAALEVGMTFDPVFLAQKGALGPAPDVAQAREWYDRAIKLGSTDAARHIERLAAMER
jgi:hypothetical protein